MVAPAPVEAPVATVKKEESKSDLIAVRLAKMRAEKAQDPSAATQSENSTSSSPRKLPSKGFFGFIKKLFGKG